MTAAVQTYNSLIAFLSLNTSAGSIIALDMAPVNDTASASVILLDYTNYTAFSYTNANITTSNRSVTLPPLTPRFSAEIPIWLIPCYSIILLFAIVGNLLVISTLVQNRRMRTITNLFLLNLAISDILLGVLCMPVTLVGTLLRHFIFGEFLCKLIPFSQAASVAVSSWTLVAISCERYYAICHPLRSRTWQTINHAYKIIGFIWIGSIICMTPIALFSQLRPTSRQGFRKCREYWPKDALGYERSYNILLDLILLVLPLMILCIAYILITRTLYVGMKNERAMIFGNSSSKLNTQTESVDIVAATTTLTPSSGFSINMPFRWHSRSSGRFGSSSNSHGSNFNPDIGLTYQQQQLPCHDTLTQSGSKRRLLTATNGRRHLYCMRSVSMKSLHRPSNAGGSNNCIMNTCGGHPAAPVTQSMIVTNMPQQQRFKLHPQRQQQQQDAERYNDMSNVRGAEAALRRTNTTKNLESKRRVVKMMFVLVLEFFICWTPLYVINTLVMFLGPALYEYIDYTSISFFQLLAYSSSCCNPITYCFMNASFRRAFLDTFKGMQLSGGGCCCARKRFKNGTNLSLAGNSITLASSGTIMTTNTMLDSPRL